MEQIQVGVKVEKFLSPENFQVEVKPLLRFLQVMVNLLPNIVSHKVFVQIILLSIIRLSSIPLMQIWKLVKEPKSKINEFSKPSDYNFSSYYFLYLKTCKFKFLDEMMLCR